MSSTSRLSVFSSSDALISNIEKNVLIDGRRTKQPGWCIQLLNPAAPQPPLTAAGLIPLLRRFLVVWHHRGVGGVPDAVGGSCAQAGRFGLSGVDALFLFPGDSFLD